MPFSSVHGSDACYLSIITDLASFFLYSLGSESAGDQNLTIVRSEARDDPTGLISTEPDLISTVLSRWNAFFRSSGFSFSRLVFVGVSLGPPAGWRLFHHELVPVSVPYRSPTSDIRRPPRCSSQWRESRPSYRQNKWGGKKEPPSVKCKKEPA